MADKQSRRPLVGRLWFVVLAFTVPAAVGAVLYKKRTEAPKAACGDLTGRVMLTTGDHFYSVPDAQVGAGLAQLGNARIATPEEVATRRAELGCPDAVEGGK